MGTLTLSACRATTILSLNSLSDNFEPSFDGSTLILVVADTLRLHNRGSNT